MEETINFDDFKLENILNPTNVEINEEEEEETEEVANVTTEEVEPEPVKTKDKKEEKAPEPVEETDEDEEDSLDFKPFVQALHDKFGWEFDDETLEENTFEGVIDHLGSIVESNVQAIMDEELSIGDGTLKKMYEYIKDGGDPKRFVDTYFRPVDYSTLELSDNDELQERVITDLLAKQGYDTDEIKDKLDTYKDANILEKEAIVAAKKMAQFDKVEKEKLLENQKQSLEIAKQKEHEYWNDVKSKISSWDKVGDFPIIDKDKPMFFEYLSKRDKEGKTQYQRDLETDKEASIKMAYIQYKKFNLESIKKSVKTEISKDVKKTISKFSDSNGKSKSSNETIENANKYTSFKLPWA
jgi:hypothetical protein